MSSRHLPGLPLLGVLERQALLLSGAGLVSMLVNVPRAKALAERRLDGHPIEVMDQVAVCELALGALDTIERVYRLAQQWRAAKIDDGEFEEMCP